MDVTGKLSVNTIIANVIRELQLKNVGDIYDSMIEWAYEAETLIGSYDTFVRKECEITVKNNRARLPRDLYRFIAFRIGGVFPEITNRDFRLFYKDSPHLATHAPQTHSLDLGSSDLSPIKNNIKMSIENGSIHISGVTEETVGGLSYLAFELDEKGYPLIKESHGIAVTAYITWKMTTAAWVRGEIPTSVYSRLENRWYWLCGQARGDDEMPDPKELEYIGNMYRQLLPLPNKNFF